MPAAPNSLFITSIIAWDIGLPSFQGYKLPEPITTWVFPHIVDQTINNGNGGETETPTTTNTITGNIKKLGLPFKANVVAVSLGIAPKVLGQTVSNELTGDYSIDVWPHVDEVMVYVAPEYGKSFSPELLMSTGHVLHPPTPNKYIYVAQNNGKLSLHEPTWVTEGQIVSGEVTLKVEPLYRPLMNGFIKPTIAPI